MVFSLWGGHGYTILPHRLYISINATHSYWLLGAAGTKDRHLPNLSTQKSAKQPVVLDSQENLPRVQSNTEIIPQNRSCYNGVDVGFHRVERRRPQER